MPVFSDITIKKSDGTTNVTYKAVQRAAGDRSPTRYEQQVGFPIPASRPQFSISAERPAGSSNTIRRVTINGVYPVYDPLKNVEVGRITLQDCKINTPRGVDETATKEAVYQLLNLAASAAVKDSAVEGSAPA